MNHKERFYATIERRPVDRPACWLGMATEEALPGLFDYFQVSSVAELRQRLDDDICAVEVPFNYPPANHIACAFNFAKREPFI